MRNRRRGKSKYGGSLGFVLVVGYDGDSVIGLRLVRVLGALCTVNQWMNHAGAHAPPPS